ncbi:MULTISPECIES: ferredoxin [Protofrankia]|uniref:Ferredoxin n=1 Tax=Candidatus Protofrankia datiscae TaxID=2716812 RepID=F8AWN7_9ACTN|nr:MULTISPECIES: ferredoxin [Protofrankia]AEH09378.1 protein of unknown function DUF1271 [Candidatus Protofrankia datiscae]
MTRPADGPAPVPSPDNGRIRVRADRERCIGAGLCVLTAPEVFEHDDDEGLVIILEATPAAHHRDNVELASRLCPTGVISVEPA